MVGGGGISIDRGGTVSLQVFWLQLDEFTAQLIPLISDIGAPHYRKPQSHSTSVADNGSVN